MDLQAKANAGGAADQARGKEEEEAEEEEEAASEAGEAMEDMGGETRIRCYQLRGSPHFQNKTCDTYIVHLDVIYVSSQEA